jgi:hypothetical protein
MLSPLRNRFGIPGVISVIALVFAMLGGAYAATNSSGGGKATASAKAKRGPRGPKGATGATGPVGSQGPAGVNGKDGSTGPAGSQGAKGDIGATGAGGPPGEDGKSVEALTVEPGEEECEGQGGAEYTVEESGEFTVICNGKEGSPWTNGGTLPAGATETGTYVAQTSAESGEFGIWAPVSFPIPIDEDTKGSVNFEDELEETLPHIEYLGPPYEEEHCPGTYETPQAQPGYLCIYQAEGVGSYNTSFVGVKNSPTSFVSKVLSSGAYLEFTPNEASGLAVVAGSFAVTGCDASLPAGGQNKCP